MCSDIIHQGIDHTAEISIQIIEKRKSIEACVFTLPMFCVITGKNGSGKTHLLEAIANYPLDIDQTYGRTTTAQRGSIIQVNGVSCGNIRLISFGQLNPQIDHNCNINSIRMFVNQAYNIQKNRTSNDRGNAYNFLQYVKQKIGRENLDVSETELLDNFDPKYMITTDLFSGQFAMLFKNYHRLYDKNQYSKYKKQNGNFSGPVLTEYEFTE